MSDKWQRFAYVLVGEFKGLSVQEAKPIASPTFTWPEYQCTSLALPSPQTCVQPWRTLLPILRPALAVLLIALVYILDKTLPKYCSVHLSLIGVFTKTLLLFLCLLRAQPGKHASNYDISRSTGQTSSMPRTNGTHEIAGRAILMTPRNTPFPSTLVHASPSLICSTIRLTTSRTYTLQQLDLFHNFTSFFSLLQCPHFVVLL
ncbi:uncharacterized protein EDB91DRAFT_72771 [Suillus paluster]|uniref:uncharacterized protein n=1 Tax=Suillus paluster TaxID=48578 RepID=UPI001B87E7FA|nr:uncharacterized protein EDB91DRAFT_72771 [Suillus paluster]KAG1747164.1 hypothetical protein EDB91DRAFT_72771 [Suillus paluster]